MQVLISRTITDESPWNKECNRRKIYNRQKDPVAAEIVLVGSFKGNGNVNFYFLIWKNFWNYILTSFTDFSYLA
jgi:hypothetical protein